MFVDGTSQSRGCGYASLNGAVPVIGVRNGKCLAYDCMTKTCKACQLWEKRKDTEEYETFVQGHIRTINHIGSAGSMEAKGVVQCFQKSVETRQLCYETYWRWRLKAYSSVINADHYPRLSEQKGECIGHIQKRVWPHLHWKEGRIPRWSWSPSWQSNQ